MHNYGPIAWTIKEIAKHCYKGPQVEIEKGVWEPARPLGMAFIMYRLQLAWDVFNGKADALYWPNQK